MNKKERILPYILFLVWPFLALYHAIINYQSKYAKNIVWFFCAFFGFTFVISSEGIDAAVYRDKFLGACSDPNIEFVSYVLNEGATDFFINFLNFVLSKFTHEYRVLFLVYGLMFGYFYSRNITILIEQSHKKIDRYSWLSLILFIFLVPFWNINGIRFYLATHIFLHALLGFYFLKKKRYLLLLLFAPYVHFSFWICNAIFALHVVLGKKSFFYIAFLLVSFFIYKPDMGTILQYLPELDGAAQDKVQGYTFHEYVDNMIEVKKNSSWFLFLRNDLMQYSLLIYALYVYLFDYKRIKKSTFEPFLLLGLLFIAIAQFMSAFPLVERFMLIGYLFCAAFLFMYIQTNKPDYWMKRIIVLTAFPFILFILVEIRIGIDVISPGVFYTNPLVAPFIEYKTPLSRFYR